MADIIMTALIPIVLFVVMVWGSGKAYGLTEFFSKDYTTALKAAACIIVILVHVPLTHSNPLQDGIGSFAYVCVTIFFMVSAYGMLFGAERKANYLQTFWRNRLVALLIPYFAINVVSSLYGIVNNCEIGGDWLNLLRINNYVVVLLEYCLWYYIVVKVGKRLKACTCAIDSALIGGVAVSSLVMYFCFNKQGWCYERWGLIYGVLVYRFYPWVIAWLDERRKLKIGLFLVLALAAGIAYLKFKPVYFYGEYLLKIVLGMIILTLLFVSTSNRRWGNRAVTFLGGISFEVYLSHGFIMRVLGDHADLPSGVFVLATVVFTIMFSWMINRWVSKPLVKRLRI